MLESAALSAADIVAAVLRGTRAHLVGDNVQLALLRGRIDQVFDLLQGCRVIGVGKDACTAGIGCDRPGCWHITPCKNGVMAIARYIVPIMLSQDFCMATSDDSV